MPSVSMSSRAPATMRVAPRWQILPVGAAADAEAIPIWLESGTGFGDGSHPTTQLCLQGIAALAPRGRAWRLLDVGSGSGILSIAGARLGASVDAVEIDPRAIEHAERCYRANGVQDRVRSFSSLAAVRGSFDLVVANVWRAALLSLCEEVVPLRGSGGSILLSGLVSTDVPEVSVRYSRLLGDQRPEVYERDEWRALVWRSSHALGLPSFASSRPK
ncbi:MAG TPA: 50S ribosomal protein L11 methyltransferase [Polyangiaceae bacterium]|nr:50S ribosomal protein L11 methyltransferase [Polyangiaceae bacterium]